MTNLGADVIEGWWADDAEADEENIGLWVRQWAKTIVILLSSGIPKSEGDWLAINVDRGGVVVKASIHVSFVK